jgi:hypothetical protein
MFPGFVAYVPDTQKIQPVNPTAPSQFIFNAFQMSLAEISKEAGVNENMQGLDNNALNKTAAGMNMRLTAGMMRQKHMAHNLARWFGRILRRILDIIRKFPPEDDVRFVGADVALRPEDYQGDYSIDIEVGVGPQDRQAQAAMMREYVQIMIQQLIPQGLATPKHLLQAIDAMFEYNDMDVTAYHIPEDEIDPWQALTKQMGQMKQQMDQMHKELQRRQGAQGNPQEETARFKLDAQNQQHQQALDMQNFELERERAAAELALKDKQITLDAAAKVARTWPGQSPIPPVRIGPGNIPMGQIGGGQ